MKGQIFFLFFKKQTLYLKSSHVETQQMKNFSGIAEILLPDTMTDLNTLKSQCISQR